MSIFVGFSIHHILWVISSVASRVSFCSVALQRVCGCINVLCFFKEYPCVLNAALHVLFFKKHVVMKLLFVFGMFRQQTASWKTSERLVRLLCCAWRTQHRTYPDNSKLQKNKGQFWHTEFIQQLGSCPGVTVLS